MKRTRTDGSVLLVSVLSREPAIFIAFWAVTFLINILNPDSCLALLALDYVVQHADGAFCQITAALRTLVPDFITGEISRTVGTLNYHHVFTRFVRHWLCFDVENHDAQQLTITHSPCWIQ